jgi:DNA-3-methyladenine glycosylase II
MSTARHTEDPSEDFMATWRRVAGPLNDLAEKHLCACDPMLGEVIRAVGPQRFAKSPARSHFDAIARSIIYQQLSKKAAATIYTRYRDIVRGRTRGPEEAWAADAGCLRSAGLSTSKVRYLKELAKAVIDGGLDLDHIDDLPDDDVVSLLTKVPGVGVWTAQMFLMFRLRRPDVLPTRDVGVQRGLQLAHGLRKPAAPGYIARAGKRWSPFRSLACLYLWAAVDTGFISSPRAETRGQTRDG